jgi:HD-GYP domain-containing protein (c-di-GMP phosphodiesterase class II)
MISGFGISRFDLIMCISETVDMVSPALSGHHKQVAYLAARIAGAHGLDAAAQRACLMAGALHDLGGMSTADRLAVLDFDAEGVEGHARIGARLLGTCHLLQEVAPIVEHHHTAWVTRERQGRPPLEAHVLHLADRVAVLVDRERTILSQVPGLLEFAAFFARLIDFRSHFTASHSQGVASVAELLARYAGFSPREQMMMRAAGLLHDLGKLAVPTEVLEKPGRLTAAEFSLMRAHTYSTWRALRPIGDIETIAQWAAHHHERLDGSGYPFHIGGADLSLGSRIMAVADVFVALTEDRPYREGMETGRALEILGEMADHGALDPRLVKLAKGLQDQLQLVRMEAQESAEREYRELLGG